MNVGLRSDIQIGLGHDPAFHLKDSDWIVQHREANTAEYVLASFRDDHEAAQANSALWLGLEGKLPRFVRRRLKKRRERLADQHRMSDIRKLSGGSTPILWRDASSMDFQSFVECVRSASVVHTDRLHCMILAVLLGKKVFAYPTSYRKLEAVYEHSIKSMFGSSCEVTFL
jgi:exopolysaccharide biosynthesis predicted pyruvyltransferase EpsI